MYFEKLTLIILLPAFLEALSLTDFQFRQKRAKNKNYDLCSRVFDVSNATIIKTSDSLKNGARYLAAVQANTRDACERSCCSTENCNVAVLEEKTKSSADGDCFLFDCGSLDDFKCIFAFHVSYVSLGMMVNRDDLEKTRIHEQAKHEMDLKILKTPPAQQQPPASATTMAVLMNGYDKQAPPPPPVQQWPDDQQEPQSMAQAAAQQQANLKMNPSQADNQQQQPIDNSAMPAYDYSQQQRQSASDSQQTQQNSPGQMQQSINRPSIDSSPRQFSNVQQLQQQQQNRDPELQRKRPPLGDNPNSPTEKISKPKALMNSRIDQPQRPPMFSEQQMGRQNGKIPITNCNRYQWACASGDQCVAVYDRCSGIAQCADGSDEQNCDQIVQNPSNDASTYDDGNGNGNNANKDPSPNGQMSPQQQPPIQKQQRPQQNWGDYYKNDNQNGYQNGNQQTAPRPQQNVSPGRQNGNGDQRGQQRQQQQLNASPGQQQPPPQTKVANQGNQFNGLQQQQKDVEAKQRQPSKANVNIPPAELSTKKESRVEFISIQKLDSSATGNGAESASLAVVILGLGLAILAMLLLFLSCRLRKVRRRLRRGKVLDTEEGEFLVNGMYL